MNYFVSGEKNECCGCGTCALACPRACITMEEDICGIKRPVINKSSCINCKICERVCPMINPNGKKNNSPMAIYAIVLNDEKILYQSTSGGAFSAIAEAYCDADTVVFGACFDENLNVHHDSMTGVNDLSKFRKSKYVKSELGDSFWEVKNALKQGRKVLFSGTPCQIAALKAYIGKNNNLLTVDLICHGTPGRLLFESYVKYLEKKYGKKVKKITMREKKDDCPYTMKVEFENCSKYIYSDEDLWMQAYFKRLTQMESCGTCPYAESKRVGDITIGDFWGINNVDSGWDAKEGVSVVMANTEKGNDIIKYVENVRKKEFSINQVMIGNKNIEKSQPLNNNEQAFKTEATKCFSNAVKKYCPISKKTILKNRIKKMLPENIKIILRKILKKMTFIWRN